jgi:hypothetical protein
VPSDVRVSQGYGEGGQHSGPAGKLTGVHRDFIMLILYFPAKDGWVAGCRASAGHGVMTRHAACALHVCMCMHSATQNTRTHTAVCAPPTRARVRTKPLVFNPDGVEDLVIAQWCGRTIPKACRDTLPAIVAAARRAPMGEGANLKPDKLWCARSARHA